MPAYKTRAIVLKKTKLKEKDLILTMLDQNGSQVRAVAKGAQKPGGNSAKLEVFSIVELMLSEGKNLDVITDVRTVETNEECRTDVVRLSYGAVMAELVEKTAFEGQESPVLFPMTAAALKALGQASEQALPFVTIAYLIKTIACLGFRPSFDECIICGAQRTSDGQGMFSITAGGWICDDCAELGEAGSEDLVDSNLAAWLKALLGMKFSQILEMFAQGEQQEGVPEGNKRALTGELLTFCEKWISAHLGMRLKSLNYLSRIHA